MKRTFRILVCANDPTVVYYSGATVDAFSEYSPGSGGGSFE